MPLSEDQKAMLRLLAQRGEQGYEDIAALKGVGVDDVRAQVEEAVRQLEDEGLPPPALPSAPAAPQAEARPAPEPRPAPETPKAAPAPERKKEPLGWRPTGIALPGSPVVRALIAVLAVAVVIVVATVLIDGGDDGGSGGGGAASDGAAQNAANNKEVTKAVLRPVDGSGASGVAIFGRVKQALALQVQAEGLEPTGGGESYTIWLAQNPRRMLPLAFTPVKRNGQISASFEVPVEVLAYLANETFRKLVVTRTENDRLTTALKRATDDKRAPSYTGERVLEGTVTGPIVGAAKEIEAREEEAEQGG